MKSKRELNSMDIMERICGYFKGIEPIIEIIGRCLIFFILIRVLRDVLVLDDFSIAIMALVLAIWVYLPIAQNVNLEGEIDE